MGNSSDRKCASCLSQVNTYRDTAHTARSCGHARDQAATGAPATRFGAHTASDFAVADCDDDEDPNRDARLTFRELLGRGAWR